MKKIVGIFCLFFISNVMFSIVGSPLENKDNTSTTQIFASQELSELAVAIFTEYQKTNPEFNYTIRIINPESSEDISMIKDGVSFLTKSDLDNIDTRDFRLTTIGRDIYVPVINIKNPYLDGIKAQGVSPQDLSNAIINKNMSWNDILGNGSKTRLSVYVPASKSFNTYFSSFVNDNISISNLISVGNSRDVLNAVNADKNAIGFCSFYELQLMGDFGSANYLMPLPLDLNGNNELDQFENIYGSEDELLRGIWIGKYTRNLLSRIYAVNTNGTLNESQKSLLVWITGEGQHILAESGFTPLYNSEQETVMAGLQKEKQIIAEDEFNTKNASLWVIVITFILGGGIFVYMVSFFIFRPARNSKKTKSPIIRPLITSSGEIPGGYYFDKKHTWAFVERDGKIRMGIDSFLKDVTGNITKIKMIEPGEKVKRGQAILTLINHGRKLEIKSPVSGTISELNRELQNDTSTLCDAPFSEGWIYIIEPLNWLEEMELLSRAKAYNAWVKKETERLKDFVSQFVSAIGNNKPVFQDGGELYSGVLNNMEPAVWEEFQISFL